MYEERIERYIKDFASNNYNGRKTESGSYFRIISGTGNVMLSVPHAVNHYRKGSIRYADINTGVIARVLHDVCDCPVIYTCCFENADANWDDAEHCLYKQALSDYVSKLLCRMYIQSESWY